MTFTYHDELYAPADQLGALKQQGAQLPSWDLTPRQICDLELILNRGLMTISDKWVPDKACEAEQVFGANDLAHPGVAYLHHQAGDVYLGGQVTGLQPPTHYDFKQYRYAPNELKQRFEKLGWQKIVAFKTRN